jgi:hypothetical protein
VALGCLLPNPGAAQEAAAPEQARTSQTVELGRPFHPVITDSPRHTLETILLLAGELDSIAGVTGLDVASDSRSTYRRILLVLEQARAVVDFSSLPQGTRREIGTSTVAYLFDILGRIDLPDPASVPGTATAGSTDAWRIPGTPLRIIRVTEGPGTASFCSTRIPTRMRRASFA